MIQRIIPFVIGITLFISGCATRQDKQGTADFNAGTTLLKIAHLPSPTADGSSLYITVDGKDAGLLPVGEAILLQLPAGEHQVGGYASSLIGHVTIPGLTVTTSADSPRFVAYRVTRNAPLFIERGVDPLPQSAPIPKKQVAQSEALPVPQIMELSVSAAETVPDAPKALTPDNPESPTPAAQEQASPASTPTPIPAAGVSEPPKEATSTAKPVEAPAAPSQPATAEGADTASPPAAAQDVKTPKPNEVPSAETPATQQKTSTVPASQ